MIKRIAAITLIWLCTAVAWLILGGTILARTYSSDTELRGKVAATWGAPQQQAPPLAAYTEPVRRNVEVLEEGKKVARLVEESRSVALPLESSRIEVLLDLEHRQKGLLWYNTYKVDFSGAYTFRNPSEQDRLVTFTLPFPAEKAVYDNLLLSLNEVPLALTNQNASAEGAARIAAGKTAVLRVSYRSQGLDTWRYKLGGEVAQVRDLTLHMRTNFRDIDFPGNTLSPTEKRETADGWDLTWRYESLVSGFQLGMAMPEKLQPGPVAGRISFFAPVSLFFFFFLILIITTIRGIEIHPMNYFFLATAFFSFHLLLAYLVDHISIHAAFAICSTVSVFLVISYLRLVTGVRFAAIEAGLTQLIYLVLFSYAFFFKGFTGLAITIGSILTLFVVMQMTGRVRWAEIFSAGARPPVAGPPS
jgi:inner membrane protein involved in colicin E2 resistance